VSRPIWLVTWNVQGAEGVDVEAVANRIHALTDGAADVIVLQEVHRDQARALATALGMEPTWAFKHWPMIRGIEGMAVLARGRIVHSRPVVVHPAPIWSWHRRISLLAEVDADGQRVRVANVHLSPHHQASSRMQEVARTLSATRALGWSDDVVVGGDCNDLPGSSGPASFVAAGFSDAWSITHPGATTDDGPTNWTVGDRAGRPPTQRLDYVFLPPTWSCLELRTPSTTMSTFDGWDDWSVLSDHLPVAARLERRVGSAAQPA
jgi:endonuclease/exonuclease/phosphatase family metal-dependent hydrolase